MISVQRLAWEGFGGKDRAGVLILKRAAELNFKMSFTRDIFQRILISSRLLFGRDRRAVCHARTMNEVESLMTLPDRPCEEFKLMRQIFSQTDRRLSPFILSCSHLKVPDTTSPLHHCGLN